MRNGLNIAGSSELVHELQSHPEEALLRFRARVGLVGSRCLRPAIATMKAGTIRVVRDFDSLTATGGFGGVDLVDQILLALGGCVLVTFVQGCSARGVTITRATVTVSSSMGVDATGAPVIGQLAYDYDVDCDARAASILEITRYTSCMSPNHRTVIEPGSVRLDWGPTAADSLVLRDVPARAVKNGEAVTQRRVIVDWHYGTQLVARLAGQTTLLIDQPKQYLGLDSAPNPLEYFLAAAAAELLLEMRQEASRRDIELKDASVMTEGSVDLRGITNVDQKKPASMYDIKHSISFQNDLAASAIAALAASAAPRTLAHAIICREHAIDVTVAARSERIGGFRSDTALLEDFLAELAGRSQRNTERSRAPAPIEPH